jgi:hypothetical protein
MDASGKPPKLAAEKVESAKSDVAPEVDRSGKPAGPTDSAGKTVSA